MKLIVTCLAVLSGVSQAQTPGPKDFPPNAVSPSAQAITEHLAGRVFAYKLSTGADVRVEFNGNGYFFVNSSGGFDDSGKWAPEDGKLCGTLKKLGPFCNEARMSDGVFYARRGNGEIIRYEPR
jgi:hypothetical protein